MTRCYRCTHLQESVPQNAPTLCQANVNGVIVPRYLEVDFTSHSVYSV
jgi:hypothetical protein